ncbi:MAG TPA: hypothetical protein VG096_06215 [Bryobacteraceae bacterium]|jgi:Flp pilus assembly pilin Flp|nr:hypothetical protein [Bryobacteraceae bacterium]
MKRVLRNFLADENGQDLIEYSLLMAFVALASYGLGGFWAVHQHLRHI